MPTQTSFRVTPGMSRGSMDCRDQPDQPGNDDEEGVGRIGTTV